jgi:hypothetical protein
MPTNAKNPWRFPDVRQRRMRTVDAAKMAVGWLTVSDKFVGEI